MYIIVCRNQSWMWVNSTFLYTSYSMWWRVSQYIHFFLSHLRPKTQKHKNTKTNINLNLQWWQHQKTTNENKPKKKIISRWCCKKTSNNCWIWCWEICTKVNYGSHPKPLSRLHEYVANYFLSFCQKYEFFPHTCIFFFLHLWVMTFIWVMTFHTGSVMYTTATYTLSFICDLFL